MTPQSSSSSINITKNNYDFLLDSKLRESNSKMD
eukprot:CAMPEP_0116886138 /NCGR_PEP_ID=MMETSP0463-20121206/19835_1 /TAXON_ID=181622 /ORGANISM="Strombidinopsis sp, Strain SopsisLIS2011" /LENGTH=33 /DNA_ID= /DNA_START= /DNA_END= /DNA_ORIENTATION=